MKVLVINCGSSSLKYQVIDSETEHVLAKGLCERIGIDGVLTYQPAGQDKIKYEAAMPAHRQAVELVLKQLTNPENGILKSIDEIDAVGHRMVHGGEKFACHVQKFLNDLIDSGLAHGTVSNIRFMLSDMFDKAVLSEYIRKNPCIGVPFF